MPGCQSFVRQRLCRRQVVAEMHIGHTESGRDVIETVRAVVGRKRVRQTDAGTQKVVNGIVAYSH